MSKKISRRNRRIRNLLLVISMMMVVAMASVGVTVAWLTDSTDAVVNTFTAGDINITLQEHSYNPQSNTLNMTSAVVTQNSNYKIVPGLNLPKDPYITVKANSEACWLFVEITQSANWLPEMTWDVDNTVQYGAETAWAKVDGEDNVYYIKVNATNVDTSFNVLKDKQIVVDGAGLTKAELDALTASPTLTFRAYACQQEQVTTLAAAWEAAKTAQPTQP